MLQEVAPASGGDFVTVLANAGIVTGLIDAFRRAFEDKVDWARFGALIAIAMGLVTAEAAVFLDWYGVNISWQEGLLVGLNVGLAASGANRLLTRAPATVVVEGTVQGGAAASGMAATATVTDPAVSREAPVAPPPPAPMRPLPPEYGRLPPPAPRPTPAPPTSDPGSGRI